MSYVGRYKRRCPWWGAIVLLVGCATPGIPNQSFPQIPGLPDGPPLDAGKNAEETYELNYVWMQHTEARGHVTPKGYALPMQFWQGYRGKYKDRLGPVEFYDSVGRADVHPKAVRHLVLQIALIGIGAGLLVGDGIYVYRLGQRSRESTSDYVLPGLIGVAGVATLLVARGITPSPTSEADAREMTEKYNQRLRGFLGLPPIVEQPTMARPISSRAATPLTLSWCPVVIQTGGGVVLGGAF